MNTKELLEKEEITETVSLPIIEMVNKSKQDFYKYLSKKICGTEELIILKYMAIEAKDDIISLKVTCNTSLFRENYKKRTMEPQNRLELLIETIYKNLSTETDPQIYNTWIKALGIIGETHPNFSFKTEFEKKD